MSDARNAGESAICPGRGNPLRRSCVSSARNAGESAIWFCPAQPSAEIARVECAKCRLECGLTRSGATLCGDRACRSTMWTVGKCKDCVFDNGGVANARRPRVHNQNFLSHGPVSTQVAQNVPQDEPTANRGPQDRSKMG